MTFTRQQARCRVQPHPSGTRQVGLGPGVQVGEIFIGAAGAIEPFLIGDELNQIARGETRGDTKVAKNLYQQPGAVSTRTHAAFESFFWCLHARFHTDQIFYVLLKPGV